MESSRGYCQYKIVNLAEPLAIGDQCVANIKINSYPSYFIDARGIYGNYTNY
jgi:hypothetical protein